jgi:hypothetical protein
MFCLLIQFGGKMLFIEFGKISRVLIDKNRGCKIYNGTIVSSEKNTRKICEESNIYSFHWFKFNIFNNLSIKFHILYKFAEFGTQMR